MYFCSEIPVDEFNQFVLTHNESHFTQFPQWGVWSKKSNCTFYLTGIKNKKNEIMSTALILEKKIPFTPFKRWYIPYGFLMDYSDFSVFDFFVLHIKKMAKSKNVLSITLNPRIKKKGSFNHSQFTSKDDLAFNITRKFDESSFFPVKKENAKAKVFDSILIQLDLSKFELNPIHETPSVVGIDDYVEIKVSLGKKEDLESLLQVANHNKKMNNSSASFIRELYDFFSYSKQIQLYICEFDFENSFHHISNAIGSKDSEFRILSEMESKTPENEHSNRKLLMEDMIRVETELQELEEKLRKIERLKKRFKHGRLIAASLLLCIGNKAWCLYEVYDNEIKKDMSDLVLQKVMIKEAKNMGCLFYEFKKKKKEESSESVTSYTNYSDKNRYDLLGEFECILFPKTNRLIQKIFPKINFERGNL